MSRLIHSIGVAAAAFLLAFLLLHALPGDPADRLGDRAIPAEQAERTRRALGLDAPLPEQFLRTVAGYARGDLGVSYTRKRPVVEVIAEALPATIRLAVAGMTVGYGAGLAAGLMALASAPSRRRRWEGAFGAFAAVPRFLLAVGLVLVFHAWLVWLPASHEAPPGGGDAADRLRHLLLPALAFGLPVAAWVARMVLAAGTRELRSPHVRAARASGRDGLVLVARHVLRPASAPLVAAAALDLGALVAGSVVVETVFAWPGLGRVSAESILAADYPLALACTTLGIATVVAGRHVGEVLGARLDPRRPGLGSGA